MKIKVVVVEDELEQRTRFSEMLRESSSCEFLGAFDSAEAALKEIPLLKPDVVLMDIHLPGITGIEAIAKLKPVCPQIQFVICTVMEDTENIFSAFRSGASGYLLKSTKSEKIIEAIEDVHRGGSPMSSEIARKVIGSFQQKTSAAESLTKRENEIVDLLAKGFRYKEISEQIFISMDTVRSHIRNIYEKLQVNSRTEAVLKINRTS